MSSPSTRSLILVFHDLHAMPAVVAINLTATAPAGIEPEEGGLILAEPRTRRAAPSPHGQLVSPPGGGGDWVRVILSPLLEEVEEVFLP